MRRLKLRPSVVQRDDDSSSKPGLKRTLEEDDTEGPSNNIRSVALGSRKQLCINEDLRRRHGDLDEACRQLLNGML
jgi:chromosome transmission fidelity protein 1